MSDNFTKRKLYDLNNYKNMPSLNNIDKNRSTFKQPPKKHEIPLKHLKHS